MANPFERAAALHRRRRGIQAGAYDGASVNRLNADWLHTALQSGDREIYSDLARLRGRARDLSRNNEHAIRFLGLLEENVVGPEGIAYRATVKGSDGKPDKRVNGLLQDAWKEWSESRELTSADGRMDLRDILSFNQRTEATDGEYLIRMLPGFQNEFGFALQVLDVDQLDHEYNVAAGRNQNEIRFGVELDRWKRPVAYHIWSEHPYDLGYGNRGRKPVRVPADQIFHDFITHRAAQTRGVTWFAGVMLSTKWLRDYRLAELVGSKAGSSLIGHYLTDPEAEPDPDSFEDEAAGGDEGGEGELLDEFAPGIISKLPPGVKFEGYMPQHPTTAFGAFDKAVLRTISTGLMTSYNTLAGDYESVNYSSLRQASLSERDVYLILQGRVIRHFLRRVHRAWLLWALTTGKVDVGSYDPRPFYPAAWQGRRWLWVDPLDEIQTAEHEVALGINSRTRIAAAQGRNFEEIIQEQAEEKRIAQENGLALSGVPQGVAPSRNRSSANGNGRGASSRLVPLENGRI